MKDPELLKRLEWFDFPLKYPGETLLSHLVDKTALGDRKARIAVKEYRRFLYLAAVSDREVVPSPLIDHLWQLHITLSRTYFEDFCPRIIGRVIIRQPRRPGAANDLAYAETLTLYAAEFGERSDRNVWPEPAAQRRSLGLKIMMILGLVAGFGGYFLGLSEDASALVVVMTSIPFWIDDIFGPWTANKRDQD